LSALEIVKRGRIARVHAESQKTHGRLGVVFGNQDEPNGPFGQTGRGLHELDLTLFVKTFNDGGHVILLEQSGASSSCSRISAIPSPVKRMLPGFLEGTKGNTTRRCRVATRIIGDLRGTTVTAAPSGNRIPLFNTTTPFRTRPGIVFMPPLSIVWRAESRLLAEG